MRSKKNILITGSTGAVGFSLLNKFYESDNENVSVIVRDTKKNRKKLSPYSDKIRIHYGDILDSNSLSLACDGIDVVIHLAAIIPPQFEANIELGRKTIIQGTANLITALEDKSPNATLIYSSSVAAYGDRLSSHMISTTDPLNKDQHDEYGKAKIEAEELIQSCSLKWSIFRLTAIMGIGNHKMSGLMFEMPLETRMEICTVRDTANCFFKAIDKTTSLAGNVYNLSGGESCRITYAKFMSRAFAAYGLGKVNFHKYAFARQNFHCGYFTDGDKLEELLKFRTDSIDTYFERFHKSVPWIQRVLTRPFAGIIKFFLVQYSEPYKAYKKNDAKWKNYYFGELIE